MFHKKLLKFKTSFSLCDKVWIVTLHFYLGLYIVSHASHELVAGKQTNSFDHMAQTHMSDINYFIYLLSLCFTNNLKFMIFDNHVILGNVFSY